MPKTKRQGKYYSVLQIQHQLRTNKGWNWPKKQPKNSTKLSKQFSVTLANFCEKMGTDNDRLIACVPAKGKQGYKLLQ